MVKAFRKHFLRATDGQSTQCKLCLPKKMIIKTTGGSTIGLPPYTFENEAHHQFVEDEEKQASGRG